MRGTIESTDRKINEKIQCAKEALNTAKDISSNFRTLISKKAGKKNAERNKLLNQARIVPTINDLETLESSYKLSIVSTLSDYYANCDEKQKTNDYYRIIVGDNYVSQINDILSNTKYIIEILLQVLNTHIVVRADAKPIEKRLTDTLREVNNAHNIDISISLEKKNYEVCKCGSRMLIVPEVSELHCPNPFCAKIKTIVGAVFRDEQFYPQEGQKTKHGGYDTSRHYKFWIERLQALENKTFDEEVLKRIEYILDRDSYDRRSLTCENIREILKDSKVNATSLNDHAPLLVKTFGGQAPPQLTYQEHRILSIKFNKTMMLYDIINPSGGNKPYYPYFIYKIIEHEFRDNPEKLRLLNFIHLQSRETIIKNDKAFEKICQIADKSDGLIYKPTNSSNRL